MTDLVANLLVIGVVGGVMVALALLALHVRHNGRAGPAIGAAMAAYDEAMRPTAYDTFVEVQAHNDRKIPMPAPDDVHPEKSHNSP